MAENLSQQQLDWFIDISVKNRDNQIIPSVVLDATDVDGRNECFHVSLQKFHELRFQVATLLKEMYKLEEGNKNK